MLHAVHRRQTRVTGAPVIVAYGVPYPVDPGRLSCSGSWREFPNLFRRRARGRDPGRDGLDRHVAFHGPPN